MKEIVKTTTPIEEKVKINSFDELNDSNAKNPPAKPIIEFREHYWRFIDLAIYLLVNLQVGTTINVLSSISEEIEDVYGIELYLVVLSGTSLFVARFITTTVNFFILERLGLRKAILIASLFVAIGTGFRLLIHYHWVFILIGQFFCGFGGVFALNSQMRFCKNWIHPTKIHLYFPLVGLIPFVGIAITSILPEIFFSGDQDKGMFYYHISYLSLSVVTFLLVLVFFKEKPKEGYGYLGDDKSFVNREMVTIKKFLTTCKSLFKMKIFVKFLLIIAIARGSIITIFGINHIFFKNLDLSTVN